MENKNNLPTPHSIWVGRMKNEEWTYLTLYRVFYQEAVPPVHKHRVIPLIVIYIFCFCWYAYHGCMCFTGHKQKNHVKSRCQRCLHTAQLSRIYSIHRYDSDSLVFINKNWTTRTDKYWKGAFCRFCIQFTSLRAVHKKYFRFVNQTNGKIRRSWRKKWICASDRDNVRQSSTSTIDWHQHILHLNPVR